jgi:hypothetical protein
MKQLFCYLSLFTAILSLSPAPLFGQVTFNPTAKVTLGGSQPGSVIGTGTMPQIVSQDDLPSSRAMTFDTGVLNINTIALGTRLFETTLVISAGSITQAMTARIGHTVSSLTENSATLVGTIEAITIDPMFAFYLFFGEEAEPFVQALIGSVGMNGSISVNAEGFSYTDSFNVPNDIVSEDVQSFFQFQAVVTDTFPADLYTTPQLAGTLTVSNDLTSLTGLTSGPILDQFTVSPSETILIANFANGNNAALNARVYLFNPSQSAGVVTVRVFTLPLIGGLAQELTSTPLNLGTLEAKSALNLKLAEDILTLLGLPLPYTDNGGNLTLEFTIQAANVGGTAQVFSSDVAFGTYPLQEIPSTSAGSPTVLAASFTNSNNDAFNSRVYLWNPSASPGNVTVRVFTLPITGGLAQELTTAPLDLGTSPHPIRLTGAT